jgi:Tol biopolymer transport system component
VAVSNDGQSVLISKSIGSHYRDPNKLYWANIQDPKFREIFQFPDSPIIWPEYSNIHNKVLFAWSIEKESNAYLVDMSNGNLTNLTNGNYGYVTSARWSPDGKWIGYTNQEGLWIIKYPSLEGSFIKGGSFPDWSPDSSKLTYINGSKYIVVANPDGSNPSLLSRENGKEFNPQWTPDGQYVVFWEQGNKEKTFSWKYVDPTDKSVTTLIDASNVWGTTNIFDRFQWSPDGHWFIEPFLFGKYGQAENYLCSLGEKSCVKLDPIKIGDSLCYSADWLKVPVTLP